VRQNRIGADDGGDSANIYIEKPLSIAPVGKEYLNHDSLLPFEVLP
jgi:hypothetical protein